MSVRQVRNILVTGGAGFIGSAFIRYLLGSAQLNFQGHCVNLDALTYAGNLANLASVAADPRYFFQQGDIGDEALVEQLVTTYKIDTIIHFAAESHVDRSIIAPETFLETNVMGTFHLLEVVRRHPYVHFHQVSTDEVYGCLGEKGFFTEETPYSPNSPYSASKAAADHLVRAYAKTYGLSTCISNCSNNYGPYHFPEKLIPLMILNCFKRQPLPVYGNGSHIRDWLYVEDHAAALWLLLGCGRSSETYNIGGEAEWRNIDLVREITRVVAAKEQSEPQQLERLITFVADRPGHDYRYAIDCSKIRRELGWHPNHSFHDGLSATVDWYRQNGAWIEAVTTGSYRQWLQTNYAHRAL